jgi:hypothetical protein
MIDRLISNIPPNFSGELTFDIQNIIDKKQKEVDIVYDLKHDYEMYVRYKKYQDKFSNVINSNKFHLTRYYSDYLYAQFTKNDDENYVTIIGLNFSLNNDGDITYFTSFRNKWDYNDVDYYIKIIDEKNINDDILEKIKTLTPILPKYKIDDNVIKKDPEPIVVRARVRRNDPDTLCDAIEG